MEKISGFKASWIDFESGLYRDSFSISEDGHILSRPSANAITLPSNLVVVPGFIDEHIHGAAGFDVMDASAASLTGLTKALPQEGVTAFLATTMSCSDEAIINAIKAVVAFQKSPTPGAMIAGLHLEGPFLSKVHASVVTILARARKERGDFLTKKGRPRRNGRP
jgi:N-acetylglucosamine-6-phosphate deacetylase